MGTSDIIIEQSTKFSPQLVSEVNNLINQLVSNEIEFTEAHLKEMLENPQTFLFIAREVSSKKAAGMITLTIFRIPDSKKAFIDDVVVDENFRKRGVGTLLFKKVVAIMRENDVEYVELTSNPKRIAAINLYEKLGFQKRETNVYRLTL